MTTKKRSSPLLSWDDQMTMLVKDYQDQRTKVVRYAAMSHFVPTAECKELAERAIRIAEHYISTPEDA